MAVTNANSHGWFESWMQGREHDRGLQEQQTEESLVQFEEDDETRLEQALVRTSLTLTLLSTGNLVRSAAGKLKQLHFGWVDVEGRVQSEERIGRGRYRKMEGEDSKPSRKHPFQPICTPYCCLQQSQDLDLKIRSQSSRKKKHAAAAARALRSATLEDVLRVKEEQQIWGKKAPTKDAGRISSNYTDSCVGKGGGKRKGTPTSARIQMLCFNGHDWEEIAQESLVGPQQRKKMRPGSQGRGSDGYGRERKQCRELQESRSGEEEGGITVV
ncbi:hypothetical protein BHM03_00034641 [Ensete ventricosum]|nr:hypothetical protein BHM03_00034641 [Ensete ventricosum]